jgi:hypothetical protein
VNDPNLIPQTARPPNWQDYGRRSPEQLAKDLSAAHDRIRTLLRHSDEQEVEIRKLSRRVGVQQVMLWVQGGALAAIWALVIALIFR